MISISSRLLRGGDEEHSVSALSSGGKNEEETENTCRHSDEETDPNIPPEEEHKNPGVVLV
jgi:hypothetical protein